MDGLDDIPDFIIRYCSTCEDYRNHVFDKVRDGRAGITFAEYYCLDCCLPRSAYVTNLRDEIKQQGDLASEMLWVE